MLAKQSKHINRSSNQLIFDGINLNTGLYALAALKSGKQVTIYLPQLPKAEYHPELTFFYPGTIKNSIKALAQYKTLLKYSALFPNLIKPQRVLTFYSSNPINKKFNNTFDKLLGRDSESATLPIMTSKTKEYKTIAQLLPKGILTFEYQFDRRRAIIDLLKMCKKLGASILHTPAIKNTPSFVKSIPYENNAQTMVLKNYKWPFRNCIRMERENFNITVQPFLNDTLVHIYSKSVLHDFSSFYSDIELMFTSFGYQLTPDDTDQLKNIQQQSIGSLLEFNEVIQDVDLSRLKWGLNANKRFIQKKTRLKINVSKALGSVSTPKISFEQFRAMQNACDEKFDLAKQANIDYQKFVYLFYRYTGGIDEMIEKAYQMLAFERNGGIIWNKIENETIENEFTALFYDKK